MIKPKLINETPGWWHHCDDGFYRYREDGNDFRLAVIVRFNVMVEIVRISRFSYDGKVSFNYYYDNGRSSSFEQVMDYLFANHPDIAEYFLFHPDEIR